LAIVGHKLIPSHYRVLIF